MADIVANIAKGRVNELVRRVVDNDPANSAIGVMLLQLAEADSVLEDYDDINTLLTASGNTEATFTNYARQLFTDADLSTPTVNDTDDEQSSDLPDVTWADAGGTTDNSLVKLIIFYDSDTTAGDDSNLIPLSIQDFVATTDGNNLVATINDFFSAS